MKKKVKISKNKGDFFKSASKKYHLRYLWALIFVILFVFILFSFVYEESVVNVLERLKGEFASYGAFGTESEIFSCTSISSPGSYILMNDVTYTGTGTCIAVSANNVDLNCNNHYINGTAASFLITLSGNNVTLRNCLVYGVDSVGITNINIYIQSGGVTLENVTSYGGRRGIQTAGFNILKNVTIVGINRESAIQFNGNNNVLQNVIIRNTPIGILGSISNYNDITDLTMLNAGSSLIGSNSNIRNLFVNSSSFSLNSNNQINNAIIYNSTFTLISINNLTDSSFYSERTNLILNSNGNIIDNLFFKDNNISITISGSGNIINNSVFNNSVFASNYITGASNTITNCNFNNDNFGVYFYTGSYNNNVINSIFTNSEIKNYGGSGNYVLDSNITQSSNTINVSDDPDRRVCDNTPETSGITACSELTNSGGCTTLGCEWSNCTGSLSGGCINLDTQGKCDDTSNKCLWNEQSSCLGTANNCDYYDGDGNEAVCENHLSCSYATGYCTGGSGDCCDTASCSTSSECASCSGGAGSWTAGDCSGTENACDTFTEDTSCNNQGGCNWGLNGTYICEDNPGLTSCTQLGTTACESVGCSIPATECHDGSFSGSCLSLTDADCDYTNSLCYLDWTDEVNLTIVNSTYNLLGEFVGINSNLYRAWYYQARVNDTKGFPIENAEINIKSFDELYSYQFITDSLGYTPKIDLLEYFNNGGTRIYRYDYSSNASYNSKFLNKVSLALIGNLLDLFTFDVYNPNGTLINPEANSYKSSNQNFTINLTDEFGMKNATLYIYNETDLVNETFVDYISGALEAAVGVVVELIDGIYTWFWSIFDINDNQVISENMTLVIDKADPIWYENKTNLNSETLSGSEIFFNITFSDINPKSYVFSWYNGTDWENNSAVSYINNQEIEIIKQINIDKGKIIWRWYVEDLAGNKIETPIWKTNVGSIPPIVNIIYPSNDETYYSEVNGLNYSVYSKEILDSCWYGNLTWNSTSILLPGINFTELANKEGLNNFYVYCNDTDGNIGFDDVNFYFYNADYPVVNLISPRDAQLYNSGPVNIAFIFSVDDKNIPLKNCSVNINNSRYFNTSRIDSSGNIIEVSLSSGIYTVYLQCTNILGNTANTNPLSFSINPGENFSISLKSPVSGNRFFASSYNVFFTYDVFSVNPLSKCIVNLGNDVIILNSSAIRGISNRESHSLGTGSYSVYVSCFDSLNKNASSSSASFLIAPQTSSNENNDVSRNYAGRNQINRTNTITQNPGNIAVNSGAEIPSKINQTNVTGEQPKSVISGVSLLTFQVSIIILIAVIMIFFAIISYDRIKRRILLKNLRRRILPARLWRSDDD